MSAPVGRGGFWLLAVPVLVSLLLVAGFVRAGLQIHACMGSFPPLHAWLALLFALPALLPLFLPGRHFSAGLGLGWIFGILIYIAVAAPPAELLTLLPSIACR